MDNDVKAWLSLIAVICICSALFYGARLHFEASSYNKLTNPPVKATAWDAVWVHLRVINCKSDKNT